MPTIAVVDDHGNGLSSASMALKAEGYRVATYTDGPSALDGFRTVPPDLAILDIKLPRMDSLETMRLLRAKSDLPRLQRRNDRRGVRLEKRVRMISFASLARTFCWPNGSGPCCAVPCRRTQYLRGKPASPRITKMTSTLSSCTAIISRTGSK